MLTLLLATLAAPEVTVVLLNPSEILAPEVERASRAKTLDGRAIQSGEEILAAITGLADPRVPSAVGLSELLEGAERMFFEFQTDQGLELLEQVIRAYDLGASISTDVMLAAAAASQMIAAEQFGSRPQLALESAIESVRRFPDVPVDALKYPPRIVKLFERARSELKKTAKSKLLVTTSAPGEVYVDGHNLGQVNGRIAVDLAHGSYKVWVEGQSGRSFARTVTMRPGESSAVFVETALESNLTLTPRVALNCPSEKACAERLGALAKSAGTGLAVGLLDRDGRAMSLRVNSDGDVEWRELTQAIPPPIEDASNAEFSALYLVPFGVGQFAQERYVAGGIYAAAQVGLLAWNLQATSARDDAQPEDPDIDTLDNRQNLSAALFYGAVAASIIESVVIWAVE